MQSLRRLTVFYSHPSDPAAKTLLLCDGEPYLTYYDKERGYVLKANLLREFPDLLHEADFTYRSCVVETLENATGTFVAETQRLPVY
jgi:hypothetical protein